MSFLPTFEEKLLRHKYINHHPPFIYLTTAGMTPTEATRAYIRLVEARGSIKGHATSTDTAAVAAAAAGVIPSTEQVEGAGAAAATFDGPTLAQPPPTRLQQRPRPPILPPLTTSHAAVGARPFGRWVEGLSASAPLALYPRKRLDITYADLLFALRATCFGGSSISSISNGTEWPGFPPSPSPSSLSSSTAADGAGVGGWTLPCLSVRTGWDLLLRALALPVGSEVRGVQNMLRVFMCESSVPSTHPQTQTNT